MNVQALKKSVKEDGMNLKYIPDSVDKYFDICVFAIDNDPYAIQFVSPKVKGYSKLCLRAVKTNKPLEKNGACALEFIPHETEDYETIALAAVKNRWRALEYVNKKWKDVEAEIKTPVDITSKLRSIYITKREIVAIPSLKNLPEICLIAVKQSGLALKYVPFWISNYEELCLEACKQDGLALLYVHTGIDLYLDVCVAAVRQNKDALEYVHTSRVSLVKFKSMF